MLAKITAALVAYGPWGVFLIGLIDSLGLPLPATMDALLILIAVKAPERAYFTALMAVLGSMGGNLALFLGARYGVRRFINQAPEPGKPKRFREWFHRYGLLTVFVPAVTPVLPLPLKVFVISAGVLHTPIAKFTIVVLVARVIRYFGEAYLGVRMGADAQGFLQRNAWTMVGVAIGLAFLLYFLIRWNDRRADSQPLS
ncbi:MAG TPA: VTT domain-containing protein [Bryobacteraceae bacterium]|nr:VTT domain-containing protein [Bryobacteraceae bacterium]